MAFIGYCNLYN